MADPMLNGGQMVTFPPVAPGPRIEEMEDGGATVDFAPVTPSQPTEFGANLAEHLDDTDLMRIGSDIVAIYEADKRARAEWERAYLEGVRHMGMIHEDRTKPWSGASGVYHPILMEAVIRFQAQAMMEVFPAGGPVKTKIIGRTTSDLVKQAERVREEMNYFATVRMTEYRSETEKLLFHLPVAGSAFRKVYYDPNLARPAAMFVSAEDFVVPYGAANLETAPRYTHALKMFPNELRKLQAKGLYRDVDCGTPAPSYSTIESGLQKITKERPAVEQDDRHTILEMHIDYDIPGFEESQETPFVITVEKQSNKVLGIRRNWRQGDQLYQKRMWFVHYPYMPGFGFYGTSLINVLGAIAKASTSLLRQLIDAGTLSNLPGGLKTKGLRIKGDSTPIEPGEWRDVDIPAGAIRENIYALPYKEPSAVLYQLLTALVDEGRKLGSVADMAVADMSQQTPVGTTLAIIERVMKIMSAVQARVHAAMQEEFRLIAEVIRDMGGSYEYQQDIQADRAQDFSVAVDVIPVSDPNATTTAQRIMQYQAAIEMSARSPEIYNLPELHRATLETLGVKDASDIVKLPEEAKPTDPVTENMAILTLRPVKAFPEQDHEAHLKVHMDFSRDPKIRETVGQAQKADQVLGAMEAHIAEHIALDYRRKIETKIGVPLPQLGEPLPPDIEADISRLQAQAAAKLLAEDIASFNREKAEAIAEDPMFKIEMKKLELQGREIERKREADRAREALERDAQESREEIEGARIAKEMALQAAESDTEIKKETIKAGARGARKLADRQ